MIEHLIITIIQTIGFAIIWRLAGSGYKRYWFFILGAPLLALSYESIWGYIGLFGAMTLLRVLPTGHMFAAIHGQAQKVDGWIPELSWKIHMRLPAIQAKHIWYRYGIIYAALRNSLALPFIILSGHYELVVFLLAGFVYYGFGKVSKEPVRNAELTQGAVFALMLQI